MFLRCSVVLLLIIALLAPLATSEELRFTYRTYRYVIVESGWVVEVTIAFWEPWVSGRSSTVDIVFEVKESNANSVLSITSVTLSTGNVSLSSYVGVFRGVGERKSTSLTLELSEPRFSKLNPGDSRIEFFTLTIKGYIETVMDKILFSREYRIPVLIVSPAGALRVSIDVARNVKIGSDVVAFIVISNRGANTMYNVEVKVYINNSLVDVAYHPVIEPGSHRALSVNFKADRIGLHLITVTCRYLTQEYGVLSVTQQALLYVKSHHLITITSTISNERIRVLGIVSPPVNETVYVEMSTDGARWTPIKMVKPNVDGLFDVIIEGVEGGLIMLRARIPETTTIFESISNVVTIVNMKSVETKTITHVITQTQVITRTIQTPQQQTIQAHTTNTIIETPSLTTTQVLQTLLGILALGAILAGTLLFMYRRR